MLTMDKIQDVSPTLRLILRQHHFIIKKQVITRSGVYDLNFSFGIP
jgi:hypothetical protein